MIINETQYDGLRPIEIDHNKVHKLSHDGESEEDTLKRYIYDTYHIINSRDWMFGDTDKSIIIFYPKITHSKVNKIKNDIGKDGD